MGIIPGAGYSIRNRQENDTEDDIDIDGDDAALFGQAQFTEADIIGSHNDAEDVSAEIDIGNEEPLKEQALSNGEALSRELSPVSFFFR